MFAGSKGGMQERAETTGQTGGCINSTEYIMILTN